MKRLGLESTSQAVLHNSYKRAETSLLRWDLRAGTFQGDFLTTDIQTISEHRRLNWAIISVLVVLHAGAIAALFMFSWHALIISILLYWVSVGLGISMGYHRLHTHRSYRLPRALEYFFAVCGTLSLEGGPIFWVATHRIHHQFSDKPGDPHSPREGAWWSHIGWLLVGESKHNNTRLMAKYAPDLAKDPFYAWLNTYHWMPTSWFSGFC